jgi:thiosulfate/3-mercaptopyruvate sulfurtransferase
MIDGRGVAPLSVLLVLAGSLASSPPPTPYPDVPLGSGVYEVPGDTGHGSEGRPNAGFVITDSGVLVIDALGSPWQGKRLLATIRTVTAAPVRWLVLTHHHPDHAFGAIVFTRAGARVIASPDRHMLIAEGGDDELVASWDRVVGVQELQGFAFADTPSIPVTGETTFVFGGRRVEIAHQPNAHTAGDLTVWIPDAGVLFAGDLLIEDGVPMVVDGSSAGLLAALDRLAAYRARVVVPGHGRLDPDPGAQLAAAHRYLDSTRAALGDALAQGTPLSRVLRRMPPPDTGRPVSLASRRQRNAVVIYQEMEKRLMGVGSGPAATGPGVSGPAPSGPRPPGLVPAAEIVVGRPRVARAERFTPWATLLSTDSLAMRLAAAPGQVTVVDVRTDFGLYLKGHIPGAVYLNVESLRSFADGVPNLLLPAESYETLFTRLGIRAERPVVVYSAGDTRNIDATYVAWILSGFGAPVALLDGGFQKWELEQRPTAREYPSAVTGAFHGRRFLPDRATRAEVAEVVRLHPADAALVDARAPDQYAGEAGAQMRRGHIPGAISHYWQTDLRDDLTHVFRDTAAIRAAYVAQGITPDKAIIAYCNGGLESSHLYFVLHDLLGYPRVRVYDGSWTDWAARPELPIVTGPNP